MTTIKFEICTFLCDKCKYEVCLLCVEHASYVDGACRCNSPYVKGDKYHCMLNMTEGEVYSDDKEYDNYYAIEVPAGDFDQLNIKVTHLTPTTVNASLIFKSSKKDDLLFKFSDEVVLTGDRLSLSRDEILEGCKFPCSESCTVLFFVE